MLRGYVFTWKGREGGMALALGMGECGRSGHGVVSPVMYGGCELTAS